jgi:hypothetical protein
MTPNTVTPTQNDEQFIRFAFLYLCGLFILVPLTLFSLYGQLFGPTWSIFFGIAGFLSAMAVFFLSGQAPGQRFIRICPRGLSERFPGLRKLDAPLQRAMLLAAWAATIGLITLFAFARLDGVPGTPVFAQREHYIFTNHSTHTEVSRLRYCLAGVGFHAGWHFGAIYGILLAIRALIFARIPEIGKNSDKGRSK